MTAFLQDPYVMVALVGLVGVALGHILSTWGKKQDVNLSKLQLNVSFLQAEYERLNKEVDDLRKALDSTRRSERILKEKLSAALTDSATIRIAVIAAKTRLAAEGVWTADLPPVPEIIRSDLEHDWPELFE